MQFSKFHNLLLPVFVSFPALKFLRPVLFSLFVFPAAAAVHGCIGAGFDEGVVPAGKGGVLIQQIHTEVLPLPPEFSDAGFPALATQAPDVNMVALDPRIGLFDDLEYLNPRSQKIEENGLLFG